MITIRHTRAAGTLVDGTSRGDGSNVPLKAAGFRWSRTLGCWYLPQSRDQAAKSWKIGAAVTALEAAGFEVAAEVDNSAESGRAFADAEAERYERADRRADYHDQAARSASARSDAAWQAEHGILDGIPAGQPILAGHHSERRHRRDLDRAESLRRRGTAEAERSGYHAERAQAARQFKDRREDIPRTLRRIAKLEAEERSWQRALRGERDARALLDDVDGYKPAESAYRERAESELATIGDQLAYWRGHVKAAEESGVKVWTRADFTKGDFARRRGQWVEVIRVNAKSLTVPAILDMRPVATRDGAQYSWTDTLPYDEIRGRKSAGEMAEILAEVERREAAAS